MKLNLLLNAYGFLLPQYETLSGEQFAELIAKYYSTENPRNAYMCEIAERHIQSIQRIRIGYNYTLK